MKPARIETVVIFMPDIYSCMPNRAEWEVLQQQYKQACEKFLAEDEENDDEVVEIVAATEETSVAAAAKEVSDNVGDANVSVENKTVAEVVVSESTDDVTAEASGEGNNDENSEMPIVILLQSTDHKFIFCLES